MTAHLDAAQLDVQYSPGSAEEKRACEEFLDKCTSALRGAPRDAVAQLLLVRSKAYEKLRRYSEAVADLRAVDAIDPSAADIAAEVRRLLQLSPYSFSTDEGVRQVPLEELITQAEAGSAQAAVALSAVAAGKEGLITAAAGGVRILKALLGALGKEGVTADVNWVRSVLEALAVVAKGGPVGAKVELLHQLAGSDVATMLDGRLDDISRMSAIQLFVTLVSSTTDKSARWADVRTALVKQLNETVASGECSDALLAAAFEAYVRIVDDTTSAFAFVTSRAYQPLLKGCGSSKYEGRICSVAVTLLGRVFSFMQEDRRDVLKKRTASALVEEVSSMKPENLLVALRALAAVFGVGPDVGSHILCTEGVMEGLMESIEFQPEDVQVAAVDMLSSALADDACRSLIVARCSDYLQSLMSSKNELVNVSSAVALTKVMFTDKKAAPPGGSEGRRMAELCGRVVKSRRASPAHLDHAVEGLAYLSRRGDVKQIVAWDSELLKAITEVAQGPAEGPIKYGIAVIFENVTNFKPKLDTEETLIQKLKELSTPAKEAEPDPLDDDAKVKERCARIVAAGAVPGLVALAKTQSETTTGVLSRAFLNIATVQELRGSMAQQGGVKSLLAIAHAASAQIYKPNGGAAKDRSGGGGGNRLQRAPDGATQTFGNAAQAIAKVGITLDPALVFRGQDSYEAVRHLVLLLESESGLRQYEALLALTNFTVSPDLRAHVHKLGAMSLVEDLQFSSNVMLRGAATELICNMVNFEPYARQLAMPASANRIHLLLALADCEDRRTELAASGALAVLSELADVCKTIISLPRCTEILRNCLAKEAGPDLQHRAAQCLLNLACSGREAIEKLREGGVVEELNALVTMSPGVLPPVALKTARHALQLLNDRAPE